MLKSFKTIALILVIVGCKNVQKEQQKIVGSNIEEKTQFKKKEITDLWISDGNMENDTILLISPGGPKWELDMSAHGRTNYRYIPNYKKYGIAYVHQVQSINDSIRKLEHVLTFEDAKYTVKKNTEMLSTVISHFKKKNKIVIIIGKSQGAYVVQHYLATEKSMADKYFILAGRLKVNDEMTQQQLKGFNGEFSKDGLTYIPEDANVDLSGETEQETREYKNKQMLKAGYGATDYTQALKDSDLSNVTYIYGTTDQNIGRLTDLEVSFLQSKGVKVIKTDKDHSGVTYAFIDKLTDGTLKL